MKWRIIKGMTLVEGPPYLWRLGAGFSRVLGSIPWFMMLRFTMADTLLDRNFNNLSSSDPCPTDVPISPNKLSRATNVL
jgi:hypothetical protein